MRSSNGCLSCCCGWMLPPSTNMASIVFPGQPLAGPSQPPAGNRASLGAGTYRRGATLLSSLVGRTTLTSPSSAPTASSGMLASAGKGKSKANETEVQGIVSVQGSTARFPIPETGSTVLAKVIRVSPRQATCSILVVNDVPCGINSTASSFSVNGISGANHHAAVARLVGISANDDGNPDNLFQGVIRAQDVRATNKDSVRMNESFRPGDIVRATVVSDSHSSNLACQLCANRRQTFIGRSPSETPAPTSSARRQTSSVSSMPFLPARLRRITC